MDSLSNFLLLQLVVVGAFLVALATYLIKKEVSFSEERHEFLLTIQGYQRNIIELKESIRSLSADVIRLELYIRESQRKGGGAA